MLNIAFDSLKVGYQYSRIELASLWGYKNYHAIRRGIILPRGYSIIILFITTINDSYSTQYNDVFSGNIITVEGEKGHSSDKRIEDNFLKTREDKIYLFHREKHHEKYIFYGQVEIIDCKINFESASMFKFNITKEKNVIQKKELEIYEEETRYIYDSVIGLPGILPNLSNAHSVNPYTVQTASGKKYIANGTIGRNVIISSNYSCEIGKMYHSSFVAKTTGHKYMEPHHIIPISEVYRFWDELNVNIDCEENIVALCPICHKKIHLGIDEEKTEMLSFLFDKKIQELNKIGIYLKFDDLLKLYNIS